jgi:hypothetical protein
MRGAPTVPLAPSTEESDGGGYNREGKARLEETPVRVLLPIEIRASFGVDGTVKGGKLAGMGYL